MIDYLLKLSNWFDKNNLKKSSQEVKNLIDSTSEEYTEPWHKEIIDELKQKENQKLQDLEDKYVINDEDEIKSRITEVTKEIATKEGFKLIFQSKDVFVGRGSYGLVLRGIYQGKPAVIKIEQSSTKPIQDEIINWMIILKAKESMPPKYKKHIPDIYKINSGKIESEEKDIYYSVTIMEELFKLNYDIRNIMMADDPNLIRKILLNNLDYIYNISADINYILKEAFDEYHSEFIFLPKTQDIFKIIYDVFNISIDTKYINNDLIFKNISTQILSLITTSKPKFNYIKYDVINLYDIERKIINLFRDLFSEFPDYQPNNDFFIWKNIPETKTFIETLEYLHNEFKLSWSDLHTDNIMMDRDGNLKIIDVGLYERT